MRKSTGGERANGGGCEGLDGMGFEGLDLNGGGSSWIWTVAHESHSVGQFNHGANTTTNHAKGWTTDVRGASTVRWGRRRRAAAALSSGKQNGFKGLSLKERDGLGFQL